MEERKYISEIISEDEIDTWDHGNVVIISADTDSGKSHFIKHKLAGYAKKNGKKILMLCHRKLCADQFKYEVKNIGNDDVISIMTYQKLEFTRDTTILDKYDYIVCDEFHYFLDDSEFNMNTDISFNKILNQSNSIRIFMSATGDDMKTYLSEKIDEDEIIEYSVPCNYNKIKTTVIFTTDELESFAIQIIKKNSKAIFFVDNIVKAKELHKQFKQNSILCYSKRLNDKNNIPQDIMNIIQNGTFDKNILITTRVLDAGVNITDKAIKYIIIDMVNPTTIKQCVGRRRIDYSDENDKVSVYIKDVPNAKIRYYLREKIKMLKEPTYLIENGPKEFTKQYGRTTNRLIYTIQDEEGNIVQTINLMKYRACLNSIRQYKEMLDDESGHGYRKEIGRVLMGDPDYKFRRITHHDTLETILKEYRNKVLYTKAEKQELAIRLNFRDEKGQIHKGINGINGMLEDKFSGKYKVVAMDDVYKIDSKTGKRTHYSKPWCVRQIIYAENENDELS